MSTGRTAKITLEGKEYTVHALNMKELQEVMRIINTEDSLVSGMKILAIGLKRSEPIVEDFDALEPTIPELGKATAAILELSGLDVNPQVAAPAK